MRAERWIVVAALGGCGGEPVSAMARDAGADAAREGGGGHEVGVDAAVEDAAVEDAAVEDAGAAPAVDGGGAEGGVSASCAGRVGSAGRFQRMLRVGSVERSFRLYAGRTYVPSRPAMLVLNFHGFTSDAFQQEIYSGMNALADARGFLVAYPQGLSNSWNGGQCCGESLRNNVDDVGFVRRVIDAVAAEWCVDPARVYATGMSNGGFLSHRLGCELSDRIAAIAPVAGVLGVRDCAPARAVPVFQFHGTLDALVPYNGGGVTGFTSVADTMRFWAMRNGCGPMSMEFLRRGLVHCDRWAGCRGGAEVQLCTVEGGGHTWPGAAPLPFLGVTARDISANEMMVDFFVRHPLR